MRLPVDVEDSRLGIICLLILFFFATTLWAYVDVFNRCVQSNFPNLQSLSYVCYFRNTYNTDPLGTVGTRLAVLGALFRLPLRRFHDSMGRSGTQEQRIEQAA